MVKITPLLLAQMKDYAGNNFEQMQEVQINGKKYYRYYPHNIYNKGDNMKKKKQTKGKKPTKEQKLKSIILDRDIALDNFRKRVEELNHEIRRLEQRNIEKGCTIDELRSLAYSQKRDPYSLSTSEGAPYRELYHKANSKVGVLEDEIQFLRDLARINAGVIELETRRQLSNQETN